MAKKRQKQAPKDKQAAALVAIHGWMKRHEKEDRREFARGRKKMGMLVDKEDLAEFAKLFVEVDDVGDVKLDEGGKMIPKFATKKDVAPVVNFYDKLALSAQIVDGGGKFLSKFVFWLAAFLVALSVISGKLWVFLGWVLSLGSHK